MVHIHAEQSDHVPRSVRVDFGNAHVSVLCDTTAEAAHLVYVLSAAEACVRAVEDMHDFGYHSELMDAAYKALGLET